MTPREFSETHFPESCRIVAEYIRTSLEMVLIVDASKIRLEDRLGSDLVISRVDGADWCQLDFEIEKRFGVQIRELLQNKDPTVNELIDFVCDRISN